MLDSIYRSPAHSIGPSQLGMWPSKLSYVTEIGSNLECTCFVWSKLSRPHSWLMTQPRLVLIRQSQSGQLEVIFIFTCKRQITAVYNSYIDRTSIFKGYFNIYKLNSGRKYHHQSGYLYGGWIATAHWILAKTIIINVAYMHACVNLSNICFVVPWAALWRNLGIINLLFYFTTTRDLESSTLTLFLWI